MSLLTVFMILCGVCFVATYLDNAERDWQTDFEIGPRPRMPRKWQPWAIGACIRLGFGVLRLFIVGDLGAPAGGALPGGLFGYFVGLF